MVRHKKGLLTQDKNVLIETTHVCEVDSYILTWTTLNLAPRLLVGIHARIELKEKAQSQIYKVKSNSVLLDQHPNLVMIPTIHIVVKHMSMTISSVLVNLATESIFLDENGILGFLDKTDVEIYVGFSFCCSNCRS